jgi:hypothetical protein
MGGGAALVLNIRATVTMKGKIFEGKGAGVIEEQLTSGITEAVAFLEGLVKHYTPQGVYGAQGGLLSTIHGEVEKGVPVVKGIVGHMKPYGDVIEKGRTVGKAMPPAGILIRWIEKKMGVDEQTAAGIEFAVRRKIGAEGFEGAQMFEEGFDEGWPTVERIFDQRGFEIARRLES